MACLYLDDGLFIGGFRRVMTLGDGKAMLMRGGTCATELCLTVGWVCLFDFNWCWLSCCGYRGLVFRFLMLGAFFILFGLNLYGFGVRCLVFIG